LVKPNYGFEKRQKELAKKRKKEEKRLRKLAEKETPAVGQPDQLLPEATTPPDTDAGL
jgi:hypothetical protein